MPVERVPLALPDIREEDIEAVTAVMRSGRLSGGSALDAFEASFARYVGARSSVGVSSGTAALMLLLEAVGVKPGDEVVTVSLSFVATANAIVRLGARPVFVDVSPDDLNMNPDSIEPAINERTKAILVVHLFGQVADMPAINAIAKRHDLPVIEDACEALGARSRSGHAGMLGDAGAFGFYANKPITTAEGGIVVSRDPGTMDLCRRLRNHGRDEDGQYRLPMTGYNFRLSDLHAALGVSQLKRLPEMLEKRQALADKYSELLGDIPGLTLPKCAESGGRHAWFTFPVRLPREVVGERTAIRTSLAQNGIETGDYFFPIHLLPYYRERIDRTWDLPVTEAESRRLIALPLYTRLTLRQVERVAASLRTALEPRLGR